MIGVYKHVVKKEETNNNVIDVTKDNMDSDEKYYKYPYLERLFKNIKTIEN